MREWENFYLVFIGNGRKSKNSKEYRVALHNYHRKFMCPCPDGKILQQKWRQGWEEWTLQVLD